MASKNQKELLEFLGPEYSLKEIDRELCVYRKINNHYDIEISGTTRKRRPIAVFVWDISIGEGIYAHTVEQHFDITDWNELKSLLEKLVAKYQTSA